MIIFCCPCADNGPDNIIYTPVVHMHKFAIIIIWRAFVQFERNHVNTGRHILNFFDVISFERHMVLSVLKDTLDNVDTWCYQF